MWALITRGDILQQLLVQCKYLCKIIVLIQQRKKTMLMRQYTNWLVEMGLSPRAVSDNANRLIRFCRKHGYRTLEELADDVFILLDQGKHTDRHFDESLLQDINRHASALKKFNGFLFVIGYRRDFVVPCTSSTNFIKCLSVAKKSTETTPCVLYETQEGKDWCTAKEICATIYIADSVLRYLRNTGKPPRCYVFGIRRYRYKIDEVNRFVAASFPKYQEREQKR